MFFKIDIRAHRYKTNNPGDVVSSSKLHPTCHVVNTSHHTHRPHSADPFQLQRRSFFALSFLPCLIHLKRNVHLQCHDCQLVKITQNGQPPTWFISQPFFPHRQSHTYICRMTLYVGFEWHSFPMPVFPQFISKLGSFRNPTKFPSAQPY